MQCNLCPRQCNALRDSLQNVGGICKMPETPMIARAALHFGEEPSISGTNGSGTVFFSGSSMVMKSGWVPLNPLRQPSQQPQGASSPVQISAAAKSLASVCLPEPAGPLIR